MEYVQKYWVFGLGFFAQVFFGLRLIAQWIQSEKSGKVVSPVSFWTLSLLAAIIFLIYGILRNDLVIIIGQLTSHFVYIRNLQLKNAWTKMHISFRWFSILCPFAAVAWMWLGPVHNWNDIVSESDLLHPIVFLGAVGQIVLSVRFVYQWYHSEKVKTSILPFGFWVISAFGSLVVVIYAVYKRDPVLLFASGLGLFIYIRNMIIHRKSDVDLKSEF